MRTFPYRSVYSTYVIILVLIVIFLFMMQYDSTTPYVDYEEAARQASYKLSVENMDGSVDVIFNIPKNSELAKKLRLNKQLSTKQTSKVPYVQGSKVKRNDNSSGKTKQDDKKLKNVQVKNRPVSARKTMYPVTLESQYVINNPDICRTGGKINFLVIVHTATDHFKRRRTIRETWANIHVLKNSGLKVAFMLGLAKSSSENLMIQNENTVYKDIVQGNFLDSYHNLTHKGVLAYRWITEYCSNAEMIVKVDDDVFVNIFLLLDHYLPLFRRKSKFIQCQLRPKGTSVIQRSHGKWKVVPDEFKNMTHYPVQYCNGYFVLMTSDMMRGLYKASYLTPFFWVDDVYLYGLLPFKVGGVEFQNLGSNVTLNAKHGLECFTGNKTCNLVGTYAPKEGRMEELWYASLNMFRDIAKRYLPVEMFLT